jgi:hypothetical protein
MLVVFAQQLERCKNCLLFRKLVAASPSELVVGNIVRRILFIVREEYATLSQARY